MPSQAVFTNCGTQLMRSHTAFNMSMSNPTISPVASSTVSIGG